MTKQYDVIILGGGTSGTIAAIAAARNGAKTLVVERYGNLGGTAVFGIPFLGMYDGRDERVNAGIPQEFVERMKKEGGALEGCFGGTWMDEQYRFSITPFEQETYKYVAQEMLLEAGAEILFHSFVSDLTLKDGNIESVEIVNKSGKTRYGAKVFIDCTGDGDIAFRAGAPFMEKTAVQNASILFKMGGVNMHRFYDALQKSEGVTGWGEWHNRVIIGKKLDTDEPGPIHLAGHFTGENGKEITFTAISIISTEVYINASRTINVDATSAEDLSRAEISERRNVWNVTRVMMANVPGFEHSHLIYSSPVGIRESRNIRGEYVLQQEDVIGGKRFEDAVVRGSYPIDIHDPKGGRTQFTFIRDRGYYTIPYRCFLPLEVDNLLVAGRCLSSTHEANGSARIMGVVMGHGQAVGTAAAIAVADKVHPRDVDVPKLRDTLLKANALI